MGDRVSKIILFFFMGSLVVLAVTHAYGFSTAAGSVFSGINGMGQTLSGYTVQSGTQAPNHN